MTTYGADGIETGPATGGEDCTQIYNAAGEPKFTTPAAGLADGSVTTAKLADGAVTTVKIADDAVTNAKLRDSAALSVIGNASNSTQSPADILASASSGAVLRENGSGILGFGVITNAGIAPNTIIAGNMATNSVENAALRDSGALSVIGRSANSSGDPADISATASSGAVLREASSVLGFGTLTPAALVFGNYWMLTNSAAESINNDAVTAVTFDTETNDVGDYHSTSVNTSRATIPTGKGGTYLVGCSGTFDTNATGVRFIYIYLNGNAYSSQGFQSPTTGSTVARMNMTVPLFGLVATDYLEVRVYQNSGAALNLNSDFALKFWGIWLGPSS